MIKDYIMRIDYNDKVYKVYLDTRTYHKTIKGVDMFVYKHKNNNWVCTDTITGACIDNVILGHKTKKAAFESAIQKYSTYTNTMIKEAQQNVLKWIKTGKADFIN
jgi:ribosomal protein S11